MKLTAIQPAALAILAAAPALAGRMFISQLDPEHNKKFAAYLIDPGLFIVTAQLGGSQLTGLVGKPIIKLNNELLIIVVENQKTNTTGKSALEVVEDVLEAMHMSTYVDGGRKEFQMGEPAYERGPVSDGVTSYLCPFRIESLNTIKSAS